MAYLGWPLLKIVLFDHGLLLHVDLQRHGLGLGSRVFDLLDLVLADDLLKLGLPRRSTSHRPDELRREVALLHQLMLFQTLADRSLEELDPIAFNCGFDDWLDANELTTDETEVENAKITMDCLKYCLIRYSIHWLWLSVSSCTYIRGLKNDT